MRTTIQLKKRGIVIIPEAVRNALKLKEGDFLEIDIQRFKSENV